MYVTLSPANLNRHTYTPRMMFANANSDMVSAYMRFVLLYRYLSLFGNRWVRLHGLGFIQVFSYCELREYLSFTLLLSSFVHSFITIYARSVFSTSSLSPLSLPPVVMTPYSSQFESGIASASSVILSLLAVPGGIVILQVC